MEQSGEEYTGGKFYSLETCCSSHGNIEISVKLLSTALEKLLGTTELVLISPVCENGQGAGAFISTTGVDFKFTKEIHDVLPLKQLKQDVRGLKTTMVVFCELLKWLLGEEKLLKSIGCHLKSKVIICPLSESILSSIELTWHMFGLVGKEIQQEIDRK
jgi:hypothetical protein